MKIKDITLLFILIFWFNGCGIGEKNYELFEKNQNFVTKNAKINNSNSSVEFYSKYYTKKVYSDSLYIYIRNNYKRTVSEKCVYGHLTNKNDPTQTIIGWEILSGKEYCKQQQQWIFSF